MKQKLGRGRAWRKNFAEPQLKTKTLSEKNKCDGNIKTEICHPSPAGKDTPDAVPLLEIFLRGWKEGARFPITIKNLRTSAGTEDEEVLWAKVFPSRKFPARFVLQLFMGPISSAELTQAKKAFSSAVREFSIR